MLFFSITAVNSSGPAVNGGHGYKIALYLSVYWLGSVGRYLNETNVYRLKSEQDRYNIRRHNTRRRRCKIVFFFELNDSTDDDDNDDYDG